ncbi:MAG TPA: PIG-L deacetylase family protein [Anaerolineales bacterium]|nr:PIG-L deacetylase family protein [Anaerolineales bacterium]
MTEQEWDSPQKILVILAHPDDPEFFCGASIAKWVEAGHQVVYWLLTCGDKGADDAQVKPEELCSLRYDEQRAAAAVLGVQKVNFLGYPDGYLVPDINLRREVTRIIRLEKPDILVTCDPETFIVGESRINHPDHRAAGQATLDAVFPAAGNPLYFPELISEQGLQPHTVKEVWISLTQKPTLKLDITPFWETKLMALLKHKSQIGDPNVFTGRMRERRTSDSTDEQPKYEEAFRIIKFQ